MNTELSFSRKFYIGSLADGLRERYSDCSGINFGSLFEYHNIYTMQTDQIAVPVAWEFRGKSYILESPRYFRVSRENSLAHELGHIILGHIGLDIPDRDTREAEADYFAEQLLQRKVNTAIELLDLFLFMVTHPLYTFLNPGNNKEKAKKILYSLAEQSK